MLAGIDISGDIFDGHIENGKTFQFENDEKKLPALVRALKGVRRVLMEATGTHHLLVAEYLHSKGFEVVVINPGLAKHYMEYRSRKNKTDKVDAGLLCEMAKDESHRLWKPDTKGRKMLKGFLRVRNDLVRQRSAKKAQLETPDITSFEKAYYAKEITRLKAEVMELDKELEKFIQSSEEFSDDAELLMSVPGLAAVGAAMILGHLPKDVETAKQAASFVGIAPKLNQSGKFKGRTTLSKKGHSGLRRQFFLSAWSASRIEGPLKAFYDNIFARTKSKKSAMCALAHKLVRIAFGVLKAKQKYDPNVLTT